MMHYLRSARDKALWEINFIQKTKTKFNFIIMKNMNNNNMVQLKQNT